MKEKALKTYAPGTTVGPYEIVSLLSKRGGMSAVYLARPRSNHHVEGHSLVVLKMANAEHNDFLKFEANWMGKLTHEHILRVFPNKMTGGRQHLYDAKADPTDLDSPYYIAIAYMRGGSVEQLLAKTKRLSNAAAIKIAAQVADALIYAYDKEKIIHFDIKDSNILLRNPISRWDARVPHAVLSDFGIAWSVADDRKPPDQVLGTREYMAPERTLVPPPPPHPRQDVFSLGVLLYQMVTGNIPFENTVIPGTPLIREKLPSVLNPAVTPPLEGVILHAIATDPLLRYQSMREFRQELGRLPDFGSAHIRLPLFQGPRDYILAGLSTLAMVLLLTIIIVVVSFNTNTPQIAPPTRVAPSAAARPASVQTTPTEQVVQRATSTSIPSRTTVP